MRISILLLITICSSCSYGSKEWYFHPHPPQATVENFVVSLVPYYCEPRGCKSFGLKIENNSDRDLLIDWNKTLFIENGLTNGGFFFEGIETEDRNFNKPPDVVFANSSFWKIIFPSVNAYFNDGWRLSEMKKGIYGIYLTLIDGENVINEKIILYLYPEEQEN